MRRWGEIPRDKHIIISNIYCISLLNLIITKKLKVVWSLAYLTCTTGFLQICLYAIVINPVSPILHQNFTILVYSLSRLVFSFASC